MMRRTNRIYACIAAAVVAAMAFEAFAAARKFDRSNPKRGDFVLDPGVTYSADDARDPFSNCLPREPVPVPGATEDEAEVPLPELKVAGIFWGAEFPQAIINDTIVKVGDTILGAKVIKINQEGVTVTFSRRDFLLTSPAKLNLETASGKKEALHEKSQR